jgi:hypothetical protein
LLVAALPIALCFAIYWPGLTAWFQLDDFWWMSRLGAIHRDGFWQALTEAPGHGTYRPVSETVFFMIFEALFGWRALPFRIFVFATQSLNLILVGALAKRMWNARLASLIAPLVWVAHTSLAGPLSWTSSYNQILGSTFLLAELLLFARWIETGKRSTMVWQWVLFLVGFGVIETNLVHPLHALAWVLCVAPSERRRELARRTIPLFAASVIFTIAHLALVPRRPPYTLSGTVGEMLHSAWGYWMWTVMPMQRLYENTRAVHHVIAALALAAALLFTAWRARTGDRRPLVAWIFYLAALAPYLPMVAQRMPAYLTIPSIGIGLLVAGAVVTLRERRVAMASVALAIGAYLFFMIPCGYRDTRDAALRTHAVERVIGGILDLRRVRKTPILVDDVSDTVYNFGFGMSPFLCLHIHDVYLTPQAISALRPEPWAAKPSEMAANPDDLQRWHDAGTLLVLSAREDRLTDVTMLWQP